MNNNTREVFTKIASDLIDDAEGEQLKSIQLIRPDPHRRSSETIIIEFTNRFQLVRESYSRKPRKRKPRGRSKKRNYRKQTF